MGSLKNNVENMISKITENELDAKSKQEKELLSFRNTWQHLISQLHDIDNDLSQAYDFLKTINNVAISAQDVCTLRFSIDTNPFMSSRLGGGTIFVLIKSSSDDFFYVNTWKSHMHKGMIFFKIADDDAKSEIIQDLVKFAISNAIVYMKNKRIL